MNSHTEDIEPDPTCTKIYYASRTHSQLTQVFPELKRLKLPGSISISSLNPDTSASAPAATGKRKAEDNNNDDEQLEYHQSRALTLGSRKHLCINDELRARVRDIDEGCRELLAGEEPFSCKSFQC